MHPSAPLSTTWRMQPSRHTRAQHPVSLLFPTKDIGFARCGCTMRAIAVLLTAAIAIQCCTAASAASSYLSIACRSAGASDIDRTGTLPDDANVLVHDASTIPTGSDAATRGMHGPAFSCTLPVALLHGTHVADARLELEGNAAVPRSACTGPSSGWAPDSVAQFSVDMVRRGELSIRCYIVV